MIDEIEISVGLFPGQGSYRENCLRDAWQSGDGIVQETFTAVDAAASNILGKAVTEPVFRLQPPSLDELFATAPDVLQLAIFGASASTFGMLRARGVAPSVLMGHSLGEIAALVSGGAFSLQDGAAVLCHRISALRKLDTSGGIMLAISCDAARAEHILALVADPQVTVAVENSPRQTVVSGPPQGVGRVRKIAEAIGLGASPLRSPHPFHNPLLTEAKDELVRAIRAYPRQPFTTPVFSPILGRFYRDGDDLAELLGRHLVQPVRFRQAVRRFHEHGARIFVEIGARTTLTGLVRQMYPDVTVLAPLDRPERDGVEQVADYLARRSLPGWDSTPMPVRAADATSGVINRSPVKPAADPSPVPPPRPSGSVEEPHRGLVPESRDVLFAEVRERYAAALEYPEEVFEDDVMLEADLGVDSVKQTELIGRVREEFGLAPPPDDFRLADYDTFGKVVDLVFANVPRPSPAPTPEPDPAPDPAPAAPAAPREAVFAEVRERYAAALEYPEEVFDDDVMLEADLGVDSVKQTELIGRVREEFGLAPPPDDFRLADYDTFGKVVDLVFANAARPAPTPTPALAAAPTPTLPAAPVDPAPSTPAAPREAVFAEVRERYAAALEYPEEVFEDDVVLEADLGVDSVKQTELIGRMREEFGIAPPPDDFRLADYDTFGKVVDLVATASLARV